MLPRRGTSVLDVIAALVVADAHGQSWSLLTGSQDLGEVEQRLHRVANLPVLADIREMEAPADRLPLIAAHGPGLAHALEQIAS